MQNKKATNNEFFQISNKKIFRKKSKAEQNKNKHKKQSLNNNDDQILIEIGNERF